jgi:hypothetical protein
MRKIINEPARADVTFLLEGGTTLHANRCILLARCRSLEDKIKSQGIKTEERDKLKWGVNHPHHFTCSLPQYNLKAFEALMEFIYTN